MYELWWDAELYALFCTFKLLLPLFGAGRLLYGKMVYRSEVFCGYVLRRVNAHLFTLTLLL